MRFFVGFFLITVTTGQAAIRLYTADLVRCKMSVYLTVKQGLNCIIIIKDLFRTPSAHKRVPA